MGGRRGLAVARVRRGETELTSGPGWSVRGNSDAQRGLSGWLAGPAGGRGSARCGAGGVRAERRAGREWRGALGRDGVCWAERRGENGLRGEGVAAGLGKKRAGPVWKGWAGWAGWFLGLGPSTRLGSFLFLSPFYFLFQTPLNLKPFEFNPSTQTKRTMH